MSSTCPIHKDSVLVCPTCLAIARGRKGGKRGIGVSKTVAPRSKPVEFFSTMDCLEIFRKNPDDKLAAGDVLVKVPIEKRKSAEKSIFGRLQFLYREGYLERISRGLYKPKQAP